MRKPEDFLDFLIVKAVAPMNSGVRYDSNEGVRLIRIDRLEVARCMLESLSGAAFLNGDDRMSSALDAVANDPVALAALLEEKDNG